MGEGALVTTRIDPPHQIGAAEPEVPAAGATPIAAHSAEVRRAAANVAAVSPETVQSPAAEPDAAAVPLALTFEQVQGQAAQLAALLGKQQATLDHREAEVNARAAAVENQVRTARLWLVEKLDELAERTAEIHAAAQAGADPAPGRGQRRVEPDGYVSPARTDAADDASEGESAALLGTMRFWKQRHWQEEFERWRSSREPSFDDSSTAAAGKAASVANDRALDGVPVQSGATGETGQRLAVAERQLAARAAELEGRRRELAIERDALAAEREAFIAERQADLVRLAEQRRVMSEKLMRQRARLRRRRDDFDARELALRQLRAELLRMQQQTLEMRLGAEEQRVRNRGKGSAAEGAA
jgi:hypothetical protein